MFKKEREENQRSQNKLLIGSTNWAGMKFYLFWPLLFPDTWVMYINILGNFINDKD